MEGTDDEDDDDDNDDMELNMNGAQIVINWM